MRYCSCSIYITAHLLLLSLSHITITHYFVLVIHESENDSVNVMIPTTLNTMDLTGPKHLSPPLLDSHHVHGVEPPLEGNPRFQGRRSGNPFADSFQDPLCKLNLKETSEFVRSFPERDGMRLHAPPTPGRPLFSFSVGTLSRKSFPSKWDDAEKWLISSSCHDSPAHAPKQLDNFKEHQQEVFGFAKKSRVNNAVSTTARSFNGVSDVPLKDKFTDDAESIAPIVNHSEPSVKDEVVHHRDAGTEMTPLGSSTTSRCHTPSSPARHNTPANRSGPLAMDISQLQVCHLAKLQLGTRYDSSNWSSKEEEEEEVSKSLRHFEIGNVCFGSASESRASAWEEEEKTKLCISYQREEAKIQAWVNLQSAKAEAKSRKLEVKIQKMRSKVEEKLMKRMTEVHRKAEEWRISAQHHQGQGDQTQVHRPKSKHISCGCFP